MKNIPGKIYLQIGDECDSEDFNELSEVSWCKDKIYDNDIEFVQNKVSDVNDPATPDSTANWSKVGDKDKWLNEVRGRERNDTKPEEDLIYRIVENWGNAVHPISEMVGWLQEYASIVNERKDNVGINDAIEFADWISVEDEMPPLETVVLLWIPNEISGLRTLGVHYWNDGVSWASGDKKIHGTPTHWMPLPAPPESQPQQKEVEEDVCPECGCKECCCM